MRSYITYFIIGIAAIAMAEETQIHRFSSGGNQLPAGYPQNPAPKLLVVAGKSVRLDFAGMAADWKPEVKLYRVASARKVLLDAADVKFNPEGWQWTWVPPSTRGITNYEITFEGEPKRIVRLESRDPAWVKASLEMLAKMDWVAQGISDAERVALAKRGIQLGKAVVSGKSETASLQMIPKQGDGVRRRVVWDTENPELVVWSPDGAAGDLAVRAPRWWISPEALATDQCLIRFLDLFFEIPLNP